MNMFEISALAVYWCHFQWLVSLLIYYFYFFGILLRLYYADYCSEIVYVKLYVLEVTGFIVTFAKEVMFSPVSVCLSVCMW